MSTITLDDKDAPALKKWLVTRLEDISDADSDVLADYVLALVKSEEPDDQTRANCIENLEDFLREHTQKFVDDVFETIRSKAYIPGYAQPKSSAPNTAFQSPTGPSMGGRTSVPGLSTSPPFNAPSGPFVPPTGPSAGSFGRPQHLNGTGNGRGDQSRKRTWNDREGTDQYASGNIGDRAVKQMRRGGLNTRGARGGAALNGAQFQQPMQQPMPSPPPGFPPLDPNNPMAAIMAMQAMGMPPMPDLSHFQAQAMGHRPKQKINQRCRDYDTKGYCAAGSECPYEHGDDHIVVGQEAPNEPEDTSRQYSPNFPQQQDTPSSSRFSSRGDRRGRGRGGRERGGTNNNRGGRASFSAAGPNHDTRITSIVVEQIPEEKFSPEEVRSFFEQFGTIEDVSMQAYKRLAIVKFNEHASAKKAYESPKVVFDNRFVKVYWYKPDNAQNGHQGRDGKHGGEAVDVKQEDEEMIDPEEFAKKQAEAQRAHEEKLKKLKEAETAKEELDKRIKAQAEERRKLMEKLASKTEPSVKSSPAPAGSPSAAGGTMKSPTPGAGADGKPQTAKEKATEALRQKLAELEAEAETLGLAPEDPNASSYSNQYAPPFGRGRGGYRGGYRGYGQPFRGGGRGGWRGGYGVGAGGAVARLDNRSKSVIVTALDDGVDIGDEAVGEALRAHLYTIGSFASIQPPETQDDLPASGAKSTTVVAFHERYVAEIFIASAKHTNDAIPGVGKVDMQWAPNTVPQASSSAPAAAPVSGDAAAAPPAATADAKGARSDADVDVTMRGGGGGEAVDYDVADEEDEDRWMVG